MNGCLSTLAYCKWTSYPFDKEKYGPGGSPRNHQEIPTTYMVEWARRVDTKDVVTLFRAQHGVGAHMNPACLYADEGWQNKKVMTTLPMGDERPCPASFLYLFIIRVSWVSRQVWESLIRRVQMSITWVHQTRYNRHPSCTWVRCRHVRMVQQMVDASVSKLATDS